MDRLIARFNLALPGFRLSVDLDLQASGFTVIYGHSGSGKTRLLRCIAGLEQPDEAYLCYKGAIWQDASRCLPTYQRPLGYVFQEPSLFDHLNVRDNLLFGYTRSKSSEGPALDTIIDFMGIGAFLDRRPDQLSGGEKQRVAIARALAVRPQLLLMDEPLSALDQSRKREILPYLEQLRDVFDVPVIYVTHALDEVIRLADHLVIMERGRILLQGGLTATLARIDLPIQLGEDVGVVLNAVVAETDSQWDLTRIAFEGGSLWMRSQRVAMGRRVRLRVLARDVSLAINRPEQSSILNALEGQVDAIARDAHPASLLVRVRVGHSVFISRLTRRSAESLALAEGQRLWVQVKSVALIE